MACDCQKNQTNEESYKVLSKKHDAIGTGVFLVPDPEKGILEYKAVTVKSLPYSECFKRGENTTAFMWVAEELHSFEEVMKQRSMCGQFCNAAGLRCPGLCFCGPGNYCR